MSRPLRILLAGHDSGGLNVLAPLAHRWSGNTAFDPWFIGTPATVRTMRERVPGLSVPEWGCEITESRAADPVVLDGVLTRHLSGRWDAVVCGTSAVCQLERRLLRAAAQRRIPSFAFCDMWWAYAERFLSGEELCLPARLWVIDERMKREAEAALPPSVTVVATGNPFFEAIAARRREVGRGREAGCIRYISEPTSTRFPESRIDEFELAEWVLSRLRAYDAKIPLVVRPHPLDSQESWRLWTWSHREQGVYLDVEPLNVCIETTHLAVGISSILLAEMSLCGIPCASLRPPAADSSYYCLPVRELGISVLDSPEDLELWLRDPPDRARCLNASHLGATRRVSDDLISICAAQ